MKDNVYFLVDFDGVLTIPDKNNQPPDGLTEKDKEFWDFYYHKIMKETPNIKFIDFLKNTVCPSEIIIHTARPERFRTGSENWLKQHNIQYNKMIMRRDDDFTSDVEAKEKSLKMILQFMTVNPLAVFEDRVPIIDMYRRYNILVFEVVRLLEAK